MQNAKKALFTYGVDVGSGSPMRTGDAAASVTACPPAATLIETDLARAAPSGGRSRLQARAGRMLDTNVLANAWRSLDTRTQETMQSTAAPGAGTLFSDISRDERFGWLHNHHWTARTLSQLSLPILAPGHRCALAPSSGKRKCQVCGAELDRDARHLAPCKARGAQTRIHNAIVRRLAQSWRQVGLHVDTEAVVPELHC